MERALTRGHPAALAALDALLAAGGTHAILVSGPGGVGKTTLAMDLAAALLCGAPDRPCRECRGCRMVASGNHPDLHRLVPEGPGGQIRIGERANPEPGTVRRLIADLALLPVEGGARVAIIEQAHRLNDDAQSALLKTLEEPPAGVTIVLCADDEERLLPTIRSRCARIRLGPVGLRDMESLLADRGVADPPTAARLGRLSHGRPGVAMSWAHAPDAVVTRDGLARTLLDLLAAPPAVRLAAARGVLGAATDLVTVLVAAGTAVARTDDGQPGITRRGRPGAREARGAQAKVATPDPAASDGADVPGAVDPAAARRAPVAERRKAVAAIIEIWRDVTRDLAVVQLSGLGAVRDQALLDDLQSAATGLAPGVAAAFLSRLTRAGELLEANVSPELLLDGLLVAWPRTAPGATGRTATASAATG